MYNFKCATKRAIVPIPSVIVANGINADYTHITMY